MDLLDTFFLFRHLHRRSTVLSGQLESRVVAIRGIERTAAKCLVLALHVGKFRHWQKLCPVVLLLAAVYTKVLFQCLVLLLRLPIGLGVECST